MMKRFLCWVLGHQYFVRDEFSRTTRRVGCGRCGADWGMNDRVKALVPWDSELTELHYGARERANNGQAR